MKVDVIGDCLRFQIAGRWLTHRLCNAAKLQGLIRARTPGALPLTAGIHILDMDDGRLAVF